MSWDEINALVVKAQQGDRAAYGQLFERFQGAVYAMALERVRNKAEAQELVQEVFIHAMKKLPQLREPRCFAGWLRRITARMAINRMNRNSRVSGIQAEILEQVEGQANTPCEAIEFAETNAELHEGLKRLKDLDRETLVAFYFHGQSLQQMSDRFSSPVGTIKRRLHVARLRLKEVLLEGDLTGAA